MMFSIVFGSDITCELLGVIILVLSVMNSNNPAPVRQGYLA